MDENIEIIRRNTKLAKWLLKSLQKLAERKEETPPRPHQKPNVVTLPVPEVLAPPLLVAEGKRPSKFSHPAIRWPLYAVGGFLIIRWAWKKWKSEDDQDKE